MVDRGDLHCNANTSPIATGLTRRDFTVLAGGGIAIAGLASPVGAIARPLAQDLSRYEGAYAIDSHKLIDGYLVAPRGKTRLDIVLVVPGANATRAQVRAVADQHAQAGAFAVAPRVAGAPADIRDTANRLRGLARGNGVVRIVSV